MADLSWHAHASGKMWWANTRHGRAEVWMHDGAWYAGVLAWDSDSKVASLEAGKADIQAAEDQPLRPAVCPLREQVPGANRIETMLFGQPWGGLGRFEQFVNDRRQAGRVGP